VEGEEVGGGLRKDLAEVREALVEAPLLLRQKHIGILHGNETHL